MHGTTEDGVNVIEMGTGDELVTHGLTDEPEEVVGCISFCDVGRREIGEEYEMDECKLDTMLNAHTRILFTDVRSIDVVIEQLQHAKEKMEREAI